MKKTSNTIVFFGNERLATGVTTTAPTLRMLIDSGYTVGALVSNYKKESSRRAREPEVHQIARDNNIPIIIPEKMSDVKDDLASIGADIGVLVAFGKIIPQSIIDLFPYGIINIHPSLLPKHRGPTPIESVILNNEDLTGVTIMQLAKEMDAGPIFIQEEVRLNGTETKNELTETLLNIGAKLLDEVLPRILNGEYSATPQDDSLATYDQLILKQSGILDWSKPAQKLESEIRAFLKWPKSRTNIADTDIVVLKAAVDKSMSGPIGTPFITDKKEIGVYTKEGALIIETLVPAGKKPMSSSAFIAGYSTRL